MLALTLAAHVLAPPAVHAGGLYLMPRGVAPASQAGAQVAGSRGVHALWYNPAGLASAQSPLDGRPGDRELLIDLTLPLVRARFTRYTEQADGSFARGGSAEADSALIPIPTLGYTDSLGLPRLGFGLALLVPSGFSLDWPSRVDGEPAPQRYSLLDTRGSALATLALGAAYRPIDALSFGAALYLSAVQVGGTVAVSACDYAVCTIPEGREWEGRTRFLLGPIYRASFALGGIGDFGRIKVGLSGQYRTMVSGEARLDVSLPDQSFFDGVSVENGRGGDELRAAIGKSRRDGLLVLPGTARAGVQAQATSALSLELAGTWERWSVQDALRVDPKAVFVRDVPTLGTVEAQPVTLSRTMRDVWAVQLGGQYDLSSLLHHLLVLNAGVMLETGAFADRDLSAASLDTQKVLLGLGVSVELVEGVLLDASYGHLFMQNREVRDSQVLLPSAVLPTPADRPAIGDGNYTMEADFVGLGVRWLPARRAAK
jgi:long-chain fatty acid transport protein